MKMGGIKFMIVLFAFIAVAVVIANAQMSPRPTSSDLDSPYYESRPARRDFSSYMMSRAAAVNVVNSVCLVVSCLILGSVFKVMNK